jgi:hypothetical protein
MREALGDRVFDVVGEVLSLNKVNLPDMLREGGPVGRKTRTLTGAVRFVARPRLQAGHTSGLDADRSGQFRVGD